jgi:hypothetical protein
VADHSAAHPAHHDRLLGLRRDDGEVERAADPSGAGFDGSGNTDTMLAHSHTF